MSEKLRVAAQQADALICSARLCEVNSMSSRQEMLRLLIEATDVLRAALAEPEAKQSAYAYMYISLCDAMGYSECKGARMYSPEEWAAHLYAKTQKTQKTLTDEEIDALKGEVWGSSGIAPRSASAFARAVERKVRGEKQ